MLSAPKRKFMQQFQWQQSCSPLRCGGCLTEFQCAVNHSSTHACARSQIRLLAPSSDTYVGPGSAPAPVPVDVNDLSNHQYLKEMHYRKGGYAILMAFQKERQRRGVDFQGPLIKREIISLAQVRDLRSASLMRRKTLLQLPCRACPPAL